MVIIKGAAWWSPWRCTRWLLLLQVCHLMFYVAIVLLNGSLLKVLLSTKGFMVVLLQSISKVTLNKAMVSFSNPV